jgi:hypothetical protein
MQPAAQGGILTDPAGITLYTYDPDKVWQKYLPRLLSASLACLHR